MVGFSTFIIIHQNKLPEAVILWMIYKPTDTRTQIVVSVCREVNAFISF